MTILIILLLTCTLMLTLIVLASRSKATKTFRSQQAIGLQQNNRGFGKGCSTPVAVCIYGAIGRGWPAAWCSQKKHILEPLRKAAFCVELFVWEQVDNCFDGMESPTECHVELIKDAVAYSRYTSAELDALTTCLEAPCMQDKMNHEKMYIGRAVRYAYLEQLVADFLARRGGLAVAISGDIVVHHDIDIAELVNKELVTSANDQWAYQFLADGFYMGKAFAVSVAMQTFDRAPHRDILFYEQHSFANAKEEDIQVSYSDSMARGKMRRSGEVVHDTRNMDFSRYEKLMEPATPCAARMSSQSIPATPADCPADL